MARGHRAPPAPLPVSAGRKLVGCLSMLCLPARLSRLGLHKSSGVTRRGHCPSPTMDQKQPNVVNVRNGASRGRSRSISSSRSRSRSRSPSAARESLDKPSLPFGAAPSMSSLARNGTVDRGRAQRARYLGDDGAAPVRVTDDGAPQTISFGMDGPRVFPMMEQQPRVGRVLGSGQGFDRILPHHPDDVYHGGKRFHRRYCSRMTVLRCANPRCGSTSIDEEHWEECGSPLCGVCHQGMEESVIMTVVSREPPTAPVPPPMSTEDRLQEKVAQLNAWIAEGEASLQYIISKFNAAFSSPNPPSYYASPTVAELKLRDPPVYYELIAMLTKPQGVIRAAAEKPADD